MNALKLPPQVVKLSQDAQFWSQHNPKIAQLGNKMPRRLRALRAWSQLGPSDPFEKIKQTVVFESFLEFHIIWFESDLET